MKQLNDRSIDPEELRSDRWSRLVEKLLQAFNSRLGLVSPGEGGAGGSR